MTASDEHGILLNGGDLSRQYRILGITASESSDEPFQLRILALAANFLEVDRRHGRLEKHVAIALRQNEALETRIAGPELVQRHQAQRALVGREQMYDTRVRTDVQATSMAVGNRCIVDAAEALQLEKPEAVQFV